MQTRTQSQLQEDGFSETNSNKRVGTGVLLKSPESFSSDHSPSELRTLHDETETPSSQDPEKGAIELTGKLAKYAGEAPDGGLKAWSVIVACVYCRLLDRLLDADDELYLACRTGLACCATLVFLLFQRRFSYLIQLFDDQ